jgi:hypothetical protein
MIRTQMGTHNGLGKGCNAWDALYDTTPVTVASNQQFVNNTHLKVQASIFVICVVIVLQEVVNRFLTS